MSEPISLDHSSVVVRSAEPLSAPVEDSTVLFSVDQGKYYALDRISAAIWRAMERPITIADLCRGLEEAFDVDPSRCESDVLALLSQLKSRGLVSVVG